MAQPANDLPLRQCASLDASLSFDREPIQQGVAKVARVLVVFKHLLNVDDTLFAGLKDEDESLAS